MSGEQALAVSVWPKGLWDSKNGGKNRVHVLGVTYWCIHVESFFMWTFYV